MIKELVRDKFYEYWGHPGDGATDTVENFTAKIFKEVKLTYETAIYEDVFAIAKEGLEELYGKAFSFKNPGSKGTRRIERFAHYAGDASQGTALYRVLTDKQVQVANRVYNNVFNASRLEDRFIKIDNLFENYKEEKISLDELEGALQQYMAPYTRENLDQYEALLTKYIGPTAEVTIIQDTLPKKARKS